MTADRQTVLVVEDDGDTARSLAELVEILGHRARVAENGRVALDLLRRSPDDYCLVLLDIMMPVLDGWGFLDEHRKDERIGRIPVVIMSAALNVQTRASSTSAAAVLPKPIDPVQLEQTLERLC